MRRKSSIIMSFVMGLLMLVTGCSTSEKVDVSNSDIYKIEYAKQFNIQSLDKDIILVTDGNERETLIVPEGEEVPEEYKDAQIINDKASKLLLCSSTQPSLMRPLGDKSFDNVAAVTTYGLGEGHIEQIDAKLEDGTTKFVGKNNALDYEAILDADVDLAFISYNKVDKIAPKLEELGIPYIVDSSSLETTALGRMEWTKILGAFIGAGDIADEYIKNAASNIETIKKEVEGLEEPSVIAGYLYKGKVVVRSGGSYLADIYKTVGADYVYKDFEPEDAGTSKVTLEDFYAKGSTAKIFIHETRGQTKYSSMSELTDQAPIIKDMDAITNGDVWAFEPGWFQSVDKLDEIIADYAAIVHPDKFKDHEITYFYKVQP